MVTTAIDQAMAHMAGEDVEDTIVINGLEVTQDNASDYLSRYFSCFPVTAGLSELFRGFVLVPCSRFSG